MKKERVSVGRKDKRDLERLGIAERLLHSCTDRVRVIFGFNQREWDSGRMVKNVVRALGIPAGRHLSANNDTAFGERDFLADMELNIPTGPHESRSDKLGANIPLAELLLIHRANGCDAA